MDKIKYIKHKNFKAASIKALYKLSKGHNGLEEALDKLVNKVESKVDSGHNIIIISDRNVNKKLAPIPMLLACSFVHHSMINRKKRSKFGIVIESAEPRDSLLFSMLFG